MNDEGREEVGAFYDTEQGMLFGFLRNMKLNSHDANDVLNDAFVAICTHWSDVRDGRPREYLYTVARNEIRRRWRTRVRRPEEPLEDEHAAAVWDFAQQVTDRQALRAALDTLPPREREAVLLVHYAGFDVAGAAQVMGCTPGAVKRYAFDGRAKLKRQLGSDTGKEGT